MNGTMKAGRATKLRTRYALVNTRHKTARTDPNIAQILFVLTSSIAMH